MSPKPLYIEVFWRYRPQTLRACTQDYLAFLKKLAIHQPNFFNRWYEKKRVGEDSVLEAVQHTYDHVKRTFSEDETEDKINVFPFFTRYSNGKTPSQETILEVSIGMGEGADLAPNSCLIQFPKEGEIYDFYRKEENMMKLMKFMIDHWKPAYIEMYNTEEIESPFTQESLQKAARESLG